MEPHEFRMVQQLQTALRSMTASSGYYYTVQDIAVKLDPDQAVEDLLAGDGPRPFVILEVRAEDWDYNYGADQVAITIPVWIHWVHEPTRSIDQAVPEPAPRQDDDRQRVYWRGCADVERALGAAPGLGGTVTSSRVVRRRMHDDPRIWAVVETEIRLHRTYGQPSGA